MKITTLGAATFDVFLRGEVLRAKRDVRTHDYIEQFPLGAKLEIEDVVFSTGGGATNAAVTFARQGFDTSVMTKIGDDLPGREVVEGLRREKVDTSLIVCDLEGETGYSTLLLAPTGERTVLVYRGISEDLDPDELRLPKSAPDWLYVSSLAGRLSALKIIAKLGKVRVAYNPGSGELKDSAKLKAALKRVDLLTANRQEMQQIFRTDSVSKLMRAASGFCQYVLMTDGPQGACASDGQKLYKVGMYKDVKVVDRTGAGDAFGSGFVARLAQGDSMQAALTFASANSTSVVRAIGAKAGILDRHAKLKTMPITVTKL